MALTNEAIKGQAYAANTHCHPIAYIINNVNS
jgi:hypothetical protein